MNPKNVLKTLAEQDKAERDMYLQYVIRFGGDCTLAAVVYAKDFNRDANDLFNDFTRQATLNNLTLDYTEFTLEDWNNYWLLAQHNDIDRKAQKLALANIASYGTNSEEFKYLSDRIECAESGTQTYNTQNICEKDIYEP